MEYDKNTTWETLEEDENEEIDQISNISRKSSMTNSIRNKIKEVKKIFNGSLDRTVSLPNVKKDPRQRKISAEVTRPKLSELYENQQDPASTKVNRKSLSDGELNLILPPTYAANDDFIDCVDVKEDSEQKKPNLNESIVRVTISEAASGEKINQPPIYELQNLAEREKNSKNLAVREDFQKFKDLKKDIQVKIDNLISLDQSEDIYKMCKGLAKHLRDDLIELTKDKKKVLVSITLTEKKTCADVSISCQGDAENDIFCVQVFEDERFYIWVTVLLADR